ncbi:MAG: hypothetical protein EXS38_10730 [Opitutus sp.]|nr:hypothetical protein [Opitutus sp.]
MAHPSFFPWFTAFLAAASAAISAPAQTTANAPSVSPTLELTTVTKKAAPAPSRARAISPEVAAQLASVMPKFSPRPPKPEPKPEEEAAAAENDKPKNGIIRLPKYIVREPRPPILNERAIHTVKGLTEIAMRRYLTEMDMALNKFTLPLFGTSAAARALAMYAEDERLRNMSDMTDAARMVTATNKAAGSYIMRETKETFMRTSDFGWHNPGK